MKQSGIYKLGFIGESRFYVGSSSNLEKRFRSHKSALQQRHGENRKVQNLYDKLGKDSVYFEVIEFCEESDLLEREYFYINSMKNKTLNYKTRENQIIGRGNICACCGGTIYRKEMNSLERRCKSSAKKYFESNYTIDPSVFKPNFVIDFAGMCTDCVAEEILDKYPYVKKCKDCGIIYFDDDNSGICTFCRGTDEGMNYRLEEHDRKRNEYRAKIGLHKNDSKTSESELRELISSYYIYCLD